jgi:Vitamin K epoxide reductase family.
VSTPETTSEQAPTTIRHRGAYLEMLIGSIIGLMASFVLAVDALELAAYPNAVFSCDISAKISCRTVRSTWQSNGLFF